MPIKKKNSNSNNHDGNSTKRSNNNSTSTALVEDKPKRVLQTTERAKTRVKVKFDVGFKNTLYIRGSAGTLNWNKGKPMKNVKADEWVWESDNSFAQGEFKVLINDTIYENGPNHILKSGNTIEYTPNFG